MAEKSKEKREWWR